MKRGPKITLVVILVLGIFGALGYVAKYRYEEKIKTLFGIEKQEKIEIATPVAVTKVKKGTVRETIVLNGEIVAKREVNIFSTVPGKIKKIYVEEGERVKKGKVLAYIDRSEAGVKFAPAPVEATIDGIIKKVLVEVGAYVTPQLPLFQIIQIDEVEVVVNIPEKEIYRVKPGIFAEVKLVSYPGKVFRGRLSELSPVVDPVSRTQEGKIRLDNSSGLLKPGMFGEVTLIIKTERNVPVIPISALTRRDDKQVIFKVEDSRAVEVNPEFGITEGEKISIRKGVKVGDSVIVIGQQNVADDDRVNVVEEIQ